MRVISWSKYDEIIGDDKGGVSLKEETEILVIEKATGEHAGYLNVQKSCNSYSMQCAGTDLCKASNFLESITKRFEVQVLNVPYQSSPMQTKVVFESASVVGN